MIEGEHFIERCSCGLVVRQCRCPSPTKSESVTDGPCYHTDEEKAAGRQDHPPIGWHWHGYGITRTQHENHPDQNEGVHVHPDMPPDTPWFGNPEEMGLTDEPVPSGAGFAYAMPIGMFQALQQRAEVMANMLIKADAMADTVTALLGALTGLASDDFETFVGLQPAMWPTAGSIAAYWRARDGITKGLDEDTCEHCGEQHGTSTVNEEDITSMVDQILNGDGSQP